MQTTPHDRDLLDVFAHTEGEVTAWMNEKCRTGYRFQGTDYIVAAPGTGRPSVYRACLADDGAQAIAKTDLITATTDLRSEAMMARQDGRRVLIFARDRDWRDAP